MKYTYQLYGDGNIYTSRNKAHDALCALLNKCNYTYLPYKKRKHERSKEWIEICYPNGHTIVKRPLL